MAGCDVRKVVGLAIARPGAPQYVRGRKESADPAWGSGGYEFEACGKLQVEVSQQVGCGNGCSALLTVSSSSGVGVFGGVNAVSHALCASGLKLRWIATMPPVRGWVLHGGEARLLNFCASSCWLGQVMMGPGEVFVGFGAEEIARAIGGIAFMM